MKTTLSGCGAGCEIDVALALTDVRFWGVKQTMLGAPKRTSFDRRHHITMMT